MDSNLLQNNLAEATTELGFPTKVGLPVRREVTLETGETVFVESVVPEVMAQTLKSHFVTPGEKYLDNGNNLNGVVQNYNSEDSETEPIIMDNKKYNITFKAEGMDTEKLKSFAEGKYSIISAIYLNEEVTPTEEMLLFMIGPGFDDNGELPTILTGWDETYSQSCMAYLYDELQQSIAERITNAGDYSGEGWYNITIVNGDINNPSTVVMTIEKVENPQLKIQGAYIVKIEKMVQSDTVDVTELDSLDVSGLVETFKELTPQDLGEPDVVVNLDNPITLDGNVLTYGIDDSDDSTEIVTAILDKLYDSNSNKLKSDVVVELNQDGTTFIAKSQLLSDFEVEMLDGYGEKVYAIGVNIEDENYAAVTFYDLKNISAFNFAEDAPAS